MSADQEGYTEDTGAKNANDDDANNGDPWAPLFIPDIVKEKLTKGYGLKSANELIKLLSTEALLKQFLEDEGIKLNIIQERRFITSVEDLVASTKPDSGATPGDHFPRPSLSMSHSVSTHVIISEEESKSLDKLNTKLKNIEIFNIELQSEKQNIMKQCNDIEQQFIQQVTFLKQQLDTLQNDTLRKLQLYKDMKLDTLKEQEKLLQETQTKIDESRAQFYENLSAMSNIQERKGVNVKLVDDALSAIKTPKFAKTGKVTEIANEMAAVQKMVRIVRHADAEEDDLYNMADMSDLPKSVMPGAISRDSLNALSISNNPPGLVTAGSTENKDSVCTIVPLQVGSNSIELSIGIGITDGYDLDDDNKEDAVVYTLELYNKKKNKWLTVATKSSNDPTTIFRLDGLQDRPYEVRVKYEYFQNKRKITQFSDKMSISLKIAIIWNNLHHGKNVQFIENHRILCKRGEGHCSIVMDPMIISSSTFKKIIFAINVHKYGNKSCFGFIDYTKYAALMNGNWDKAFLYVPRKSTGSDGIYGLTAQLRQRQILCCINGEWVSAIKLKKSKDCNGYINEEDHFIFEYVFDGKSNYCNVYLNNHQNKKCLLLSGSNNYTFENIPASIVPIYSHEDHGESEVSVKVLSAEFLNKQ